MSTWFRLFAEMSLLRRLSCVCAAGAVVAGVCAIPASASVPALAPGSSFDGYPRTTHFETSCANKCDIGRAGNAITHVVFLSSEGGKDATIATEQNDSGKSIHYFAANDGSIADFIPEADTAWYAGDYPYNQTSIGIMVEGFINIPSSFGDLEYQRAAQLTAAIAHRYGFPIDAAHVLGRGDISTSIYAGQGPDPAFDLTRLRSLAQAYLKEIQPPNTAITSTRINHAKRTAMVAFTGSGGFGGLHFQCKLDSAAWTACASPKTYTSLRAGTHTLRVRAIDSRHEPDRTPAKRIFTI